MLRTHLVLILSAAIFSLGLSAACTKDPDLGEEFSAAPAIRIGDAKATRASNGHPEAEPDVDQPALAVATVASLISVSDVMVREPERFKRVLCSDSQYYELDYSNGRYSLAAEPLSVCVLFSETSSLKPLGFCADDNCEASQVTECSEPEKTELVKEFAEDQKVRRCWNIGAFPTLRFTVLMTKVGQSCQAQTLVKSKRGWQQLSSIDGVFETRKTATLEGTGCWWEAGTNFTFEDDWFSNTKRVMPIMAFEKGKGLYALMRSSWSGSENFQLFRLDGEKAIEVESFAEAFKETESKGLVPDLQTVPEPAAKRVPKGKEAKGKESKAKAKSRSASKSRGPTERPPSQPVKVPSPDDETAVSPLDEQSIPEASEATPDAEPTSDRPAVNPPPADESDPFAAP